jgi:hypothetical protein
MYPRSLGLQNSCALWREIFEPLVNLISLSLPLAYNVLFEDYGQETSNLSEIPKSIPRLEKLTIQVLWCYKEGDLFDIVTAHSGTLTHLMLERPILQSGNWVSVTRIYCNHVLAHCSTFSSLK